MSTLMRTAIVTVVLALACSHAESKPAPESTASAAGATPAPGAPVAVKPKAQSPFGDKLKDLPGAGPRLPSQLGTATSLVQGCLAAASEEEARSFPTFAPPSRSGAGADLDVEPVDGGVLVTHRLTHACCLQGTIAAQAKGDVVRVTETLSGTACRCMCGSTLKTAVRLAPGRYRLRVAVEHQDAPYQGKVERLPEQAFDVR